MKKILSYIFVLIVFVAKSVNAEDGQAILDGIVDHTNPPQGPIQNDPPDNGIVLTPDGYVVYKNGEQVTQEDDGTLKPQGAVTTAEIIEQTFDAAEECLDYCYVGTCVWLKCHILDGCDITTTMLVRHYNPDAVVSTYTEPGANPWTEFRKVLGSITAESGQVFMETATGSSLVLGNGNNAFEPSGDASRGTYVRNKEADVVGHPVPSILNNIPGFNFLYFCKSQTTAFQPYYLSTLDSYNWRYGLAEYLYPSSWIPGMNEIGDFSLTNPTGNTWAGIYPRISTVLQPDDPKAGAVFATRAASIATANGQPHIYVPLTGSTSDKGYKKLPEQTNPKKDRWQVLFPSQKKAQCDRFGVNDSLALGAWSDKRFSAKDHRDYVFNYWRQYTCCAQPPSGYHFLFHVSFESVCI
jgi:integrating conjugative element protein (TIGR03756 family)